MIQRCEQEPNRFHGRAIILQCFEACRKIGARNLETFSYGKPETLKNTLNPEKQFLQFRVAGRRRAFALGSISRQGRL